MNWDIIPVTAIVEYNMIIVETLTNVLLVNIDVDDIVAVSTDLCVKKNTKLYEDGDSTYFQSVEG